MMMSGVGPQGESSVIVVRMGTDTRRLTRRPNPPEPEDNEITLRKVKRNSGIIICNQAVRRHDRS